MIKILIVEDEVLTAVGLQRELRQAGYEVCDIVATGEKAVEIVGTEKPDVVLMDTQLMGRMNGLDAARRIIADDSARVIIMTGYTEQEIRKTAPDINPLGYAIKPVKIEHLQGMIDSIPMKIPGKR